MSAVPFRITLFVMLFIPLFLGLGCWQLERYEEKRLLEKQQVDRQQFPPLTFEQLYQYPSPDWQNLPLSVSGRFINNHHFLLDNQVYNKRVGYTLLTPFIMEDGHWILVNRGFLPIVSRETLPSIPEVTKITTLSGRIYQPSQKAFMLAKDHWKSSWPKVIQTTNFKKINSILKASMPDAVLMLSSGHPAGLPDQPLLPKQTTSDKHFGYALQWFTMAVALLCLYIYQLITTRKMKHALKYKRHTTR